MQLSNSEHAEPKSSRFALWQLGFRPFYLLASVFAALSIVLWGAQYLGWLNTGYLPGPIWHAHEMLYGFTIAVIAGFLLTAVRNWTDRPTPSGGWLMTIAALWVCGRILIVTRFVWLSALANAAFPIAVAVGIGIPLVRSHNRRNYFFIALLLALGLATFYVHAAQILGWQTPAWLGIRVGLDIVLLIMTIMAGRVIPMFTANALPDANARRHPLVERASIASIFLIAVLDALGVDGGSLVTVLVLAALSHGVRCWLWAPGKTLRTPLVWVLHAAYAWIPIHLALRAASALQLVASPLATHALTVGAIGGLTIGMMTRTAKGHTGRPLRADAADSACYGLVLAAGVVRVIAPLLLPAAYGAWVLISAALWSGGFALYAIRYSGPLTHARVDGRPG